MRGSSGFSETTLASRIRGKDAKDAPVDLPSTKNLNPLQLISWALIHLLKNPQSPLFTGCGNALSRPLFLGEIHA